MLEYIKKILGSGVTTLISNDEMEEIIKIVKSLEDPGLLLKGVTETIQNEAKEQEGGFFSILLGTLGASLSGNILAGKAAIVKRQGREINRDGEGIVRAGFGNKKRSRNCKSRSWKKMDF